MQTDYRFRNPYVLLYKLLHFCLGSLRDTEALPSYQLHTRFVSFDFLAVLSTPPCHRWITALSQYVRNTSCDVCFLLESKIELLTTFFDTRVTWETWLRPNTVPSFEWCRYKRPSIFTRQGYSIYSAYKPIISDCRSHFWLSFFLMKKELLPESDYTAVLGLLNFSS